MQLISNYSQTKGSSETEPILSQSNTAKSSSSVEIRTVGDDPYSTADVLQSSDVDDSCILVNADQPQCRICLDTGGEDLIAPCHCKGTQKYVHRSCLDNWRSTREGVAFSQCTECRAMFILRANVPPERWWLRLKFQFLVARDHAFIFVIVQLVVAFLGVLVYKFYGEELRDMFGYEEHPYAFYTMAVLAIVLVGLLYGFFIAIICGQRISERHYHVLAKQELTKSTLFYVSHQRDVAIGCARLSSVMGGLWLAWRFDLPVGCKCVLIFGLILIVDLYKRRLLDMISYLGVTMGIAQEYIVEDREANKNVAELGATHITELRMLGLY